MLFLFVLDKSKCYFRLSHPRLSHLLRDDEKRASMKGPAQVVKENNKRKNTFVVFLSFHLSLAFSRSLCLSSVFVYIPLNFLRELSLIFLFCQLIIVENRQNIILVGRIFLTCAEQIGRVHYSSRTRLHQNICWSRSSI